MKTIKKTIALTIVMLSLFACKKDTTDTTSTLTNKTISAKWQINSGGYESIEFNESGNYIITKNNIYANGNKIINAAATPVYVYGNYKIINSTTIELTNYGTINVVNITELNFSFKLVLSNNTSITITATKISAVIQTTTKTDLLCKTWVIDKAYLNDKTDTSLNKLVGLLTVLFSKYGTYFVHQFEDINKYWKWKNAAETQIYYSSTNLTDWTNARYIDIIELTYNSLIITDKSTSSSDIYTYYLKPYYVTNSIGNKVVYGQTNNKINNYESRIFGGY